MWRLVLTIFLVAALAGCADDVPPADVVDEPPGDAADVVEGPASNTAVGAGEVEILAGSLTWHSDETQGMYRPLAMGSQPVFNECVTPDGSEVSLSNLDLTLAAKTIDVPAEPKHLVVDFRWEFADYPKDRLILAYRAPSQATFTESDWVQNGEETLVELPADLTGGSWEFWACVSKQGSTTATDPSEGPKAFVGTLSFRILAVA